MDHSIGREIRWRQEMWLEALSPMKVRITVIMLYQWWANNKVHRAFCWSFLEKEVSPNGRWTTWNSLAGRDVLQKAFSWSPSWSTHLSPMYFLQKSQRELYLRTEAQCWDCVVGIIKVSKDDNVDLAQLRLSSLSGLMGRTYMEGNSLSSWPLHLRARQFFLFICPPFSWW